MGDLGRYEDVPKDRGGIRRRAMPAPLLLAMLIPLGLWSPSLFAQDSPSAPAASLPAPAQGSWRPIEIPSAAQPPVTTPKMQAPAPATKAATPGIQPTGIAGQKEAGRTEATPKAEATPSAAPSAGQPKSAIGAPTAPAEATPSSVPAPSALQQPAPEGTATVGSPAVDPAASGSAPAGEVPTGASPHAAENGEATHPHPETAAQKLPGDNPHALPGELSPWGMFLAADIVVKTVMIGLAAASFLVWSIWIAKTVQLALGRRRFASDLRAITLQPTLTAARASIAGRRSLAGMMLDTALRERQSSGGSLTETSLGRIHSRLAEIELEVGRDIRSGMSFLATVAATGPFIGLFGTVWGIMNSFIGISKSQTTNLAVVAPGIAEALLATAIGLVAAIPAVILYNNLGKGVGAYKRLARETRGEVERIASRELDDPTEIRRYPGLAAAAE